MYFAGFEENSISPEYKRTIKPQAEKEISSHIEFDDGRRIYDGK